MQLPGGPGQPQVIVDPNTGQRYLVFANGQIVPIQIPGPGPQQLFPAAQAPPNPPPMQPPPPNPTPGQLTSVPLQPAAQSPSTQPAPQAPARPRPRPVLKSNKSPPQADSDEDELPTTVSFSRQPAATGKRKSGAAAAPTTAKRAKAPAKEKPNSKSGVTGRAPGAATYSEAELERLADLMYEARPKGRNEFIRNVLEPYNAWAQQRGYQVREHNALKQRYDRLHNARPPTGNPDMPYAVRRAKEAEDAIFKDAGVTHVDDDDDDEIEIIEGPSPAFKTPFKSKVDNTKPRIKLEPSTPKVKIEPGSSMPSSTSASAARSSRSTDRRSEQKSLSLNLSAHYDPQSVAAREEQRAQNLFANTQLQSMSQQLLQKDSQLEKERAKTEELRQKLADRELAIAKLEMQRLFGSAAQSRREQHHPSPSALCHHRPLPPSPPRPISPELFVSEREDAGWSPGMWSPLRCASPAAASPHDIVDPHWDSDVPEYLRAPSPFNPFRRDVEGGPSGVGYSNDYHSHSNVRQGELRGAGQDSSVEAYDGLSLPPLSTAASHSRPTLPSLNDWAPPPAVYDTPHPYTLPPIHHLPDASSNDVSPPEDVDASRPGSRQDPKGKGKGRAD